MKTKPSNYENLTLLEFNEISIPMVWIPEGIFMMGNNHKKTMYDSFEGLKRQVKISKGFWISQHTISKYAFSLITEGKSYNPNENDKEMPINVGTWSWAMKFCSIVETILNNSKDNFFNKSKVSLPSQAEWEYMCRVGSETDWFFGDSYSELKNYAWYLENSENKLHPSGLLKPNPWGLYDIYGNINEWVMDPKPNYLLNQKIDLIDPIEGNPFNQDYAGMRGGDYSSPANICNSYDYGYELNKSNPWKEKIGFRILIR